MKAPNDSMSTGRSTYFRTPCSATAYLIKFNTRRPILNMGILNNLKILAFSDAVLCVANGHNFEQGRNDGMKMGVDCCGLL